MADALRRLLSEAMQDVANLPPNGSDAEVAAFNKFRRSVTQASSGLQAPPSELLDGLEPKDAAFRFLFGIHTRRRLYKKQVAAVMTILLETAWGPMLKSNQELCSAIPDELKILIAVNEEVEAVAAEIPEEPAPAPAQPAPAEGSSSALPAEASVSSSGVTQPAEASSSSSGAAASPAEPSSSSGAVPSPPKPASSSDATPSLPDKFNNSAAGISISSGSRQSVSGGSSPSKDRGSFVHQAESMKRPSQPAVFNMSSSFASQDGGPSQPPVFNMSSSFASEAPASEAGGSFYGTSRGSTSLADAAPGGSFYGTRAALIEDAQQSPSRSRGGFFGMSGSSSSNLRGGSLFYNMSSSFLDGAVSAPTSQIWEPGSSMISGAGPSYVAPAAVVSVLQQLENAVTPMERLNYRALDRDSAIDAFEKFRKAVNRAVKSAGPEGSVALDELEPKGKILEFVADFYLRHNKYRSRVNNMLLPLLSYDDWSSAVEQDPSVRAVVNELTEDPNKPRRLTVYGAGMAVNLGAAAGAAYARGGLGAIYVRVIAAYDLVAIGDETLMRRPDPYVRITSGGQRMQRTNMASCTRDPYWDSSPFLYEVTSKETFIKFEVLDSDLFRDVPLGTVNIRAAKASKKPGFSKHKLEGVEHGELELELVYLPGQDEVKNPETKALQSALAQLEGKARANEQSNWIVSQPGGPAEAGSFLCDGSLRCPAGHAVEKCKNGLRWFQGRTGLRTAASCDLCRQPFKRDEARWRCSHACQFDVCDECHAGHKNFCGDFIERQQSCAIC